MKGFKVPIVYERYGYLTIQAENESEAVKKAENQLEKMTLAEMEAATEYLQDSESVDAEGIMPL